MDTGHLAAPGGCARDVGAGRNLKHGQVAFDSRGRQLIQEKDISDLKTRAGGAQKSWQTAHLRGRKPPNIYRTVGHPGKHCSGYDVRNTRMAQIQEGGLHTY